MVTRYATIVADPPWSPVSNGKANPRRHYSVMTTDDICAITVPQGAQHLWLWAINAMMEDAYRVVRAWGFSPISLVTWCKPQPGVGVYVRNNTEHVVFAKAGKNCPPAKAADKTWWVWPRAEHSRKPDAFFDLVEQVSPGPYLEMFSRRARLGWDNWGDQALSGTDFETEAVA